ncbi:ribose 5-phosphate isomerase B [Pelolinea submarina]|uniref:Ribose 5-phosphate isomerase B n=1 Tax=Pelolinea submarina TaxID=913107 RepID=A0A347ZR45_9CHLR|nr:ribose 5-phosphate isomerase B [Pelolinea submarina]REG11670.1 ribose 5-phosphate isomerase B [Pelolinea submarina]BBB47776.1 ribose 5-phosphate isomerase B [Pelolinea submarina]
MKIAIGCDELAYKLKEIIKAFLEEQSDVEIELVKDCGVEENENIDYPDIAERVAKSIMSGECDRGILICGTGIGMAIAANKFPGIRAAQVCDPYSAERARKSNNAQIMTLGSLTMGPETAKYLVGIWLKCEFAGGRSTRKVDKINAIDETYRK